MRSRALSEGGRRASSGLQDAKAALNVALVSLTSGGFLIDNLPFLRQSPAWVPYLSYRPIARDAYNAGQRSLYGPWNAVKDELVKGTPQPSVAREELLEHQPFKPKDELYIAGAISTMFAGKLAASECRDSYHSLSLVGGSDTVYAVAVCEGACSCGLRRCSRTCSRVR
ncbi:hypothetical protein FA95DRAFT_615214 [Auriscalpium vulgare]|uniref:Uncharacterized protein n=1 Tax=Auriscalpium vulgare TaxID=40419 RepID=A0ACB8RDB1_9AGAM|nr:hypothetical protein FA95DRAFT_615214 [Auriscalpium vulgare]